MSIREAAKPLFESLSLLQGAAQKLEYLERFIDAIAWKSSSKFIEVVDAKINEYGEVVFRFNNFGLHELAKVKQYDANTTIVNIINQLYSDPVKIAKIVFDELTQFIHEVHWVFNIEARKKIEDRIEDITNKLKVLEEKITALETSDDP